jgi:hypothetical protein
VNAIADMTTTLEGDVLAVAGGPRIIIRLGPATIGVVDPINGTTRRIGVPPYARGETIQVDPHAVIELRNRMIVGWYSEGWAGMLDLDTGLSSGISAPTRRITALFEDGAGTEVWALLESGADEAHLLRFPLLP